MKLERFGGGRCVGRFVGFVVVVVLVLLRLSVSGGGLCGCPASVCVRLGLAQKAVLGWVACTAITR